MIKISRLTDYAVVVLSALLKDPKGLMAASAVAGCTGLPEPTVSKVLKLLAKNNLVDSMRGLRGGYRVSVAPESITVADIVMAVDGPIALTACVETSAVSCDYACHCPVKGRWDEVNIAIRSALEGVTLADMLAVEPGRTSFLTEAEAGAVQA